MNIVSRLSLCFGFAANLAVWASGVPSRRVEVPGAPGRIEILLDREGVPHIRADTEEAAQFGLGFMHARDRLWQLEFHRRLATGRLAEVLGEAALPIDRLFRLLGTKQAGTATWSQYPADERRMVQAYVAGINAWIGAHKDGPLPPEFRVLRLAPQPWQPEESISIGKALTWTVDSNWSQEILRSLLAQKLGSGRTAELMPRYASTDPGVLSSAASSTADAESASVLLPENSLRALLQIQRQVEARLKRGGAGTGSNNWVLGPARTRSGLPLMAADPHLGSQIPALFYYAHLKGGALDAIGATVPGAVGILMGRNQRIAWTWTNANADVQDLFVERLNDRNEVEFRGQWDPLQIREEIIAVRGGSSVAMRVRITRHGPLISDLVSPSGPPLAIRWTMLDAAEDGGPAAYLSANRAQNWVEFLAAFRAHPPHAQNLLFADADGNIGYLMPGSIPRRARGDGSEPVPGWSGEFEWTGYVPFQELPRAFNPSNGFLVTANNRIDQEERGHRWSNGFAAPYRAIRIHELLAGRDRHDSENMQSIQNDVTAVHGRTLLPYLLKARPQSALGRAAQTIMQGWNGEMTADSAQAAIFEAWYIELASRLFADDLGEALWASYSEENYMVAMAIEAAVIADSSWCDDVKTPLLENCADTLGVALDAGLARMASVQGSQNLTSWRWGKVHRAIYPHQAFEKNPALGPLFERSIENGGDKFTVNVASSPRWDDYDQRHVPVARMIFDFGDLDRSRWIFAPGQSGNPFDEHYDDLLRPWQRGNYRRIRFGQGDVDNGARHRLVLVPSR